MRSLLPIGCFIALVPGCMVGTRDGSGGSQIGVEDCEVNLIEIRLLDSKGERLEGQVTYQWEDTPAVTVHAEQVIIAEASVGLYRIEAVVGDVTQTSDLMLDAEYTAGWSFQCGLWLEALVEFEFDL